MCLLPKLTAPVSFLFLPCAIRDNLMTDIYGANLYNRYLEERASCKTTKTVAKAVAGAGLGGSPSSTATTTTAATTASQEVDCGWETELASPCATSCKSILVCTGVYNPHTEVPPDAGQSIKETVFHGHRDFRFDPGLVEPSHIVQDVEAAVELIFKHEKLGTPV